MKLKKKVKKAQKGETLQLGIGNDLNKEKQQFKSSSDLNRFFGEEVISGSKGIIPYSNPNKPAPHEVDAVIDYLNDKYKIKDEYFKKYPKLKQFSENLPTNSVEWQRIADQVAKENPSAYIKFEDLITDKEDLYRYKKALSDRKKFYPDPEVASDVKGTGKLYDAIGFRTVTLPLSRTSRYIHQDSSGKQTQGSKDWIYTGTEFKAVPQNLPLNK